MRNSFLLMLFFALSAHAQEWSSYFDGALFGTYVTETGPREPQNRLVPSRGASEVADVNLYVFQARRIHRA